MAYANLLDSSGRRGTVPMGTWNWVTAFDDPKETLDSLLNGDNLVPEGCINNAFYSNAELQRLFREAAKESDAARRNALYRTIERRIVEDAPWIFLVMLDSAMLVQPWLKGFTPQGLWPPARLESCWIER